MYCRVMTTVRKYPPPSPATKQDHRLRSTSSKFHYPRKELECISTIEDNIQSSYWKSSFSSHLSSCYLQHFKLCVNYHNGLEFYFNFLDFLHPTLDYILCLAWRCCVRSQDRQGIHNLGKLSHCSMQLISYLAWRCCVSRIARVSTTWAPPSGSSYSVLPSSTAFSTFPYSR